ncbi:hypothetical protein HS125_01150 [bacterium]|nr:hypothetical protein [bacterium]
MATAGWCQNATRAPQIGYLYPAGGQAGQTVHVIVGGQFVRGARDVYISGSGVRGKVVATYRPVRNIQQEQRVELEERLRKLREARLAAMPPAERRQWETVPEWARPRPARPAAAPANARNATPAPPPPPLEHPLLDQLEKKSLRELYHVAAQIFFPRQKKQLNSQIDETALLELTLDPRAEPGERELRLVTPLGLTNPMLFQVGTAPETLESEPNDPRPWSPIPPPPPLSLPALINGQIMPGDVDRFRFQARAGQQLVVAVAARRLVPYLADAVPGWFQATLALYDESGREVAFADDYRFDPDPVLFFKVPRNGVYQLDVRDSIYRGREDFVYRIEIGPQPFITRMFPLGGREGQPATAALDGWNLPARQLTLDTSAGGPAIRYARLRGNIATSNAVAYAVDALPESTENEPNDTERKAQKVTLPRIVNGRVARPGDVDVFAFEGRAGEEIVAEVHARRLGSPLDSRLRLLDASGKVLAWNDDQPDKETGLLTHHADSYLRVRLPRDGAYRLELIDAQKHGGEAYAYRLRIGPPRPDFALRAVPASINVSAGRAVPFTVHALRRDGYAGPIDVALVGAPAGWTLGGARISAGRDWVRMTLTAPREAPAGPIVLRLEGRAKIGAETLRRPVVPAEDMMQAFAYQHLVPARELVALVVGPRRGGPPVQLATTDPVRIPAGGSAQVRVNAPLGPMLQNVQLALSDPPAGVALQKTTVVPGGLVLTLAADGKSAPVGLADNLIVEAYSNAPPRPGAQPARPGQRVSLGVLPAIPCEIVKR